MKEITQGSLESLFGYYASLRDIPPHAKELEDIQQNCERLFEQDYIISTVHNTNGKYCTTYPPKLFVPIANNTPYYATRTGESTLQTVAYSLPTLFDNSKNARLRGRFPVPVILFNNKNICRSATLSQKFECVINSAAQSVYYTNPLTWLSSTPTAEETLESSRKADVTLLNALEVTHICDLMVENKKKKYGICWSSSEKTDSKQRYGNFHISAMPYPGTEFFAEWKNHNYDEKMKIDWEQHGTKEIELLIDVSQPSIPFEIDEWRNWDIVAITQNYLKLILNTISDNQGVLVHCISGWDRTPLFISLIRLSLWADGHIHTSLNANEILYLTLSYDWLLFHHYLKDRSARGEDILYFCFMFLQYITSDEYSISTIDKSLCSAISNRNGTPIQGKGSAENYGSSFGSSWEVVGYLQSHVLNTKSPPKPVPVPVLQVPKSANPVKSPASDSDGIFSMDDEEINQGENSLDDDFTVLGTDAPDATPKADREYVAPVRADRLMEVRETMLTIYKKVIEKPPLTSSTSGISAFLGSGTFNFNLFSTSQIVVKSTN